MQNNFEKRNLFHEHSRLDKEETTTHRNLFTLNQEITTERTIQREPRTKKKKTDH
jgi:hypothetical protein